MRPIDYEIQVQFIQDCFVMKYGLMSNIGVHHDKTSWRRWWYSKKTREEIKMSMEEKDLIFLSIH